ncbi:MAG: sulfotransferase, partial [Asticcacaulis sp.]|nr:sulfotransferase [Asticcacaulis sp.]
AHLSLARLKRWNRDNNHIERLKRLPVQMPGDAARFGYALFKEYDDIGDTAAAWVALQKAARAARDQPVPAEAGAWGAQDEPRSTTRIGAWTSVDDLRVVEAWRTYLPKERFVGLAPRPHAGPRRIFIVGLPRSGTTLVERVLTAHSQVQAQGELLTFPLGVKYMSGSTTGPLLDVDTVAAAAKLDPQVLTDYYLRETTYLNDGSAYAIDKLPANHSYVGLIRLAFPDAIIVHVRRNPMDSLFGAYKLLFAYSYRWSYSQDDLAEHYANYRLLMDHWKACLGDGIIDVSLEAVIAEPETQIRRLLVACGLPFEAACLNPHEAAGPVATASSVQVRSPINAEGVGAWRRYADQLGPLKQRLISMGVIDSDGNAIE